MPLEKIGGTWLDPKALAGILTISGPFEIDPHIKKREERFLAMLTANEHWWTFITYNPVIIFARIKEVGQEIAKHSLRVAPFEIRVYKQPNQQHHFFIRIEVQTGWRT